MGKLYTALIDEELLFTYSCCTITSARKSRTSTATLLLWRGSVVWPSAERKLDGVPSLPPAEADTEVGSEGNACDDNDAIFEK